MIPLKDSPKTHRFPFVNIALILINAYIFFLQLTMTPQELHNFFVTFGLTPEKLIHDFSTANLPGLTTLISYQFLHGGWLHIISNMLYLWVFGDNIEDRVGHFRYLFFYLLVGTLAGLTQVFIEPGSQIPIIGASGAVAGILGAYLISCPRARVIALIPIFIVFTIAEIPAVFFLGFWFVLQLFSGFATIGTGVNIAWWAHIGGFVFGLILVGFFGKRIADCE